MTKHPSRWLILVAVWLSLLCPGVFAQELTIRLVHGKTGKGFGDQNVRITFWWEDPSQAGEDKRTPLGDWSGTVVHVDKEGIGHVRIPAKAAAVSIRAGPKMGSEP